MLINRTVYQHQLKTWDNLWFIQFLKTYKTKKLSQLNDEGFLKKGGEPSKGEVA